MMEDLGLVNCNSFDVDVDFVALIPLLLLLFSYNGRCLKVVEINEGEEHMGI